MNSLRTLWKDEAGFVISAELVLVASMLVMGMVVGLQTVRDTVIAELADGASALGQVNQSYSFGGATGHASSISGSLFADAADFCDDTTSAALDSGTQCTTFVIAATTEP